MYKSATQRKQQNSTNAGYMIIATCQNLPANLVSFLSKQFFMKARTLITLMLFAPITLMLTSCETKTSTDDAAKFLSSGKWIDLTYSFNAKTIYWPNNPTGFKLDTQMNGVTPAGFYYSTNAFSA